MITRQRNVKSVKDTEHSILITQNFTQTTEIKYRQSAYFGQPSQHSFAVLFLCFFQPQIMGGLKCSTEAHEKPHTAPMMNIEYTIRIDGNTSKKPNVFRSQQNKKWKGEAMSVKDLQWYAKLHPSIPNILLMLNEDINCTITTFPNCHLYSSLNWMRIRMLAEWIGWLVGWFRMRIQLVQAHIHAVTPNTPPSTISSTFHCEKDLNIFIIIPKLLSYLFCDPLLWFIYLMPSSLYIWQRSFWTLRRKSLQTNRNTHHTHTRTHSHRKRTNRNETITYSIKQTATYAIQKEQDWKRNKWQKRKKESKK